MFSKLLNFDEMVTPFFVKIMYWLGVVLAILSGLGMVIQGVGSQYGGGVQVISGILTIIFGPFIVRIYCELVIVLFEIHRNIVELNRKTK